MNEFDTRAREWDKDKMHTERSLAIAKELQNMIPFDHSMKALEYGSGTGILSFLLKDQFKEITLLDNSIEMIKVCEEKAEDFKTSHIHPIWFDLEHNNLEEKFDIIYNQMVLHHVIDFASMLIKFYAMLNSGGYLAIADLYPEDGSFHGQDIDVHHGFDIGFLAEILKQIGFKEIKQKKVFEINRESDKIYPVFLMVAQKY